ncbi:hypothetical protein BST95_15505 [Halioglobus japonicus]|uniref:Uncharacterized protein n=1 Tax=Halioglobus japonicus TaxID=930805 RepID=A0AAP8SPU0_9GAMM|nr:MULTISPECIES: DUF6524 family protein [Halioglobus]AQA19431.1 hypothetical protein BST95_15505 [Halioglobus japonicus]KZX60712.1 hypothetical protein A3709_00325 [Halioglobus sp. HI00S01]PLW87513.1 hypothetical protein C0029_02690 [Halioglobus japonicus]GHD08079.1 hypothetical protein GCM10007052_04590 [Halioglobus japonicus]
MAKDFDGGSFLLRVLFAAVLVFGTYNPTSFSYVSYVLAEGHEFGPITAIIGLLLLIAWIVFLRATFLSLGWLGVTLGAALFGCIIWLFVDLGWLSIDSTGAITWLALIVLALILAVGLSWSHIRRRLTGQVDVDDIEE